MRFLPEGIAEVDANMRWVIPLRLQILEEVVYGPQASGISAPGMNEAMERINRALKRRDTKAEDAAVVDRMRAELLDLWRVYPERRLLTDLYRRAARRQEGGGSPDSRRPPSHPEGLRVARGLLVDIPDTGRLDAEQESEDVSKVLAAQWLPPIGVPSRVKLREYIRRSPSSRAYFDALTRICEELDNRGEAIPGYLARWREEVADERLQRPAMKPVPSHRPANPDQLKRDMHIQFAIEVLGRVGVRPSGSDVSGCRIVSEALGLSEDTVTRTWKTRIWRKSIAPAMRKYSKAIAERNGPFIPPEA